MKIKVVHRSEPPPPHPAPPTNQETVETPNVAVPKQEIVADDENRQVGGAQPKSNSSLAHDSTNPINSETPPSSQTLSSPLLGKRKRKPKSIVDQFSPILSRKKTTTKKPQSNNVAADVGGNATSSKKERAIADVSGSASQVKSPTIIRAEEFKSSIGNEYPSFMKLLVRSHVGSCFWMGLPMPFCKQHLPRKDTTVILESENGEEFEVKYFAEKTGLSAGWRKFAAAHKLVEGDVLVFQLVGPTRFKVYVIRANDLKEVDGALSLLNLDALAKQNDAGVTNGDSVKKRQKKSLPLTVVQKRRRKEVQSKQLVQLEAQSGNDSDEVASEIFEGSRSSGLAVNFRDVKSFEEFHILVNGVCVDSELPGHVRRKYYEICCSKDAFLHDRLLQGLHCKLVAGMILEVVSIADAIRACKLTTPRKDFDIWEKSLRSFELLGMNVGFLRTRLRWLLSLAFDSEGASDAKRYWEAKNELTRAEDEIRDLEKKLGELKQTSGKCGADVEALKSKAESYELMFQGEVNAPW